MIKAIETTIGASGEIHLPETIKIDCPCRAIVILIEGDHPTVPEITLLSQQSLSQDWDREEEDIAWSHLQ